MAYLYCIFEVGIVIKGKPLPPVAPVVHTVDLLTQQLPQEGHSLFVILPPLQKFHPLIQDPGVNTEGSERSQEPW